MSAEVERLHPPVLYASWWWVVALLCLLAAVAVVVALRRAARTPPAGDSVDVEALRTASVARIEALVAAAGPDPEGRRRAARDVGAEVRTFLGVVADVDIDYTTRRQWATVAERDPRFLPVVALLDEVTAAVFPATTQVGLEGVGHRAREVVTSWR